MTSTACPDVTTMRVLPASAERLAKGSKLPTLGQLPGMALCQIQREEGLNGMQLCEGITDNVHIGHHQSHFFWYRTK